jgi:predicted RNA-binding Zn-ribbon protein involved in translation (DUF1610 family)
LADNPVTKLSTLREILGSLKRRRPSKKFCPKCGNPNIKLSSSLDVWLLPEQYLCEKCGYRGPIALEVVEEESSEKEKGTT